MGRVFRYTVIVAIACVMVLVVRIATVELNKGMEFTYTEFDISSVSSLGPEPNYDPMDIDRPTFGMASTAIDSLPEKESSPAETGQPEEQDATPDEQAPQNNENKKGSKVTADDKPASSSASSNTGSDDDSQGSGSTSNATAPDTKPSTSPYSDSSSSSSSSSSSGSASSSSSSSSSGGKGSTDSGTNSTESLDSGTGSSSWYKAPSGYTVLETDDYLISIPKGWTKQKASGEFGGDVYISPAETDGSNSRLTLVSTDLEDNNGLSIFANSGNEVVNEVIANAGLNASIIEKGYESIGIHTAYYIFIEVPSGNKTTLVKQYYIFYNEKVTMVEYTGIKGQLSDDHVKKTLASFVTK